MLQLMFMRIRRAVAGRRTRVVVVWVWAWARMTTAVVPRTARETRRMATRALQRRQERREGGEG